MTEALITGVVFIIVGLVMVFIGYLLKVRRMTSIIAGYDPVKVADEEGLLQWVGKGLYVLAVATFGSGVTMILVPAWVSYLILVDVGISIAGMVIMIVGMQRYMKPSSD